MDDNHLIVSDMRECCYGVVPLGTWTQEGWGFVLEQDGHILRVNAAGMRVSFLQVSVKPDDHEQYATIPFFRELSRHGTVKAYSENGFENRPDYHGDGNQWLMQAIQEAVEYINRMIRLARAS